MENKFLVIYNTDFENSRTQTVVAYDAEEANRACCKSHSYACDIVEVIDLGSNPWGQLDKLLQWEGIFGSTSMILGFIKECYGVTLE